MYTFCSFIIVNIIYYLVYEYVCPLALNYLGIMMIFFVYRIRSLETLEP